MKNWNLVFILVLLVFCGQLFSSEAIYPPLVPEEILGTTGYYRWRYDNFMTRHPDLEEPSAELIPDYYLGYGEKYVVKFTEELYPKLSTKGKPWLIRARLNLQLEIESRCEENPVSFGQLEEKPDSFRSFAFDTHLDAYWDAGLAELPLFDLIKIGTTPDVKDLLSKDGLVQFFAISKKLGKDRIKKILDFFRNIHTQARELVEKKDTRGLAKAITYLEGLSKRNRKVLVVATGGFRQVRRTMKLQIRDSKDDMASRNVWKSLLSRLEGLRRK